MRTIGKQESGEFVQIDYTLPSRIPCWYCQTITNSVSYLIGMLRSQKHVEVHGIVYDGYLPC